MRASRSRRLSRRTTASTTSIPPLGLASACSSSASESTRQWGVRVAAHRAARSTPWGVPKSRSIAVGVGRVALLEHREDRAAVVVDDDDRQVGARLVGAEHERVRVVQERHVADQRERPRRRGLPRAAPIGGRDGAVDARQPAVGDDLAPAADVVARHHQVEVAQRARRADDEEPAGRQRAGHGPGDVVRREARPRRRAARRAEPERPTRRPRATRRARRGRRPPRRSGARRRGRPRTAGRPRRPSAGTDQTSTSARDEKPGHGARERGVADHHDPLDALPGPAVEQQAIATQRVRARA